MPADGDGAPPDAPALPVLRLQLTFRAETRLQGIPAFRGAFWRGVFGAALHRIADTSGPLAALWPQAVSAAWPGGIARAALYRELFAPEEAVPALPPHLRPPAPFVVDAPHGPAALEPGDHEMIGLTLIGERAASALPAVLAAFALASEQGLGDQDAAGRRGRARLADAMVAWREPGAICSVLSQAGGVTAVPALVPPVPPVPPRVRIGLMTPLRLVRQKQPVAAEELTAGDLLEALVRRASALQRAHGPGPIPADFGNLFAAASRARMEKPDLQFAGQQRWSGTQQQEIEMGGIVGSFELSLAGLEALWPYIWLGQWVHAGKGAVMGLGAIRLGGA